MGLRVSLKIVLEDEDADRFERLREHFMAADFEAKWIVGEEVIIRALRCAEVMLELHHSKGDT